MLDALTASCRHRPSLHAVDDVADEDLHLALYLLYELHHRGWDGVDPDREWDPSVIELRTLLEERFLLLLRGLVPDAGDPGSDVTGAVRAAIADHGGPPLAAWVRDNAELSHLRELAVHRSLYQLKEADQHTWAVPRLGPGPAKSALLRLQLDEYGGGAPGRSHAELFATTMASLGLDPTYGRYVDLVPGTTLATVNLLWLFALHRRWTGACLGHLAVFEMTSVGPMTCYAAAHRRVCGEVGAEFYDVHVRADVEHEAVAADQLLPTLVADHPPWAADVMFGAQALLALEARAAEAILAAWSAGRTSLRGPLEEPVPPVLALERQARRGPSTGTGGVSGVTGRRSRRSIA